MPGDQNALRGKRAQRVRCDVGISQRGHQHAPGILRQTASDQLRRRPDTADKVPLAPAQMLRQQQESSFRAYLMDLLRERGGKVSEVYKRAEISKQLFSNILNREDYQPTKNTVIQLAIGLQLDLPQTQKLLDKAGYTLTRSSKRDLAIRYCIEHKMYNVTFINEALFDCGYPLLSTGSKA